MRPRAAPVAVVDEAPLPPGWEAVASKSDGRTFYHNDATGEKAWVRPRAAPEEAVDDDLPAGWVSVEHDNGGIFYHHAETGETVWDKPAGDDALRLASSVSAEC